ncbi:MAG: zinc ribbon domain-containing protein [Kaiparowitsia implicata GSE-PSE-MK54-09C]|nr:zinc ribbon domain-containing protein [Kaiparowitsia implicata GSE-PSE-MK54-09C]
MTLRTGTSKTGRLYRYYTCSGAARVGKTLCKGRSIAMDTLDTMVVVDHLSERLFTSERLTVILASLAQRRTEKDSEVSRRIATLEAEAIDAEEKLRRLYSMVEEGVAELDDILRKRIAALRAERERANAALERIRPQFGPNTTAPAALIRFGQEMREKISTGDIGFRRTYLRSVIDHIEVADDVVRIVETKQLSNKPLLARPEFAVLHGIGAPGEIRTHDLCLRRMDIGFRRNYPFLPDRALWH